MGVEVKKGKVISPVVQVRPTDLYEKVFQSCRLMGIDGKTANMVGKDAVPRLKELILESIVMPEIAPVTVSASASSTDFVPPVDEEKELREEVLRICKEKMRSPQLSPTDQLKFITELNKLEDNYKSKSVEPVINIKVVMYDVPPETE